MLFRLYSMSRCRLHPCHLPMVLPAEVNRQRRSPAGYCEAVPEGLVKRDGWPSSPRAFPRPGRLLQLLTTCASTPLSGLHKLRCKTLDETNLRMESRICEHNWNACVQTLVPTCRQLCVLYTGAHPCRWAFHCHQVAENTADSNSSLKKIQMYLGWLCSCQHE